MNVLLVFNADDAEAAAVATHYQSARSLPADHLCGLAGIDPLQRAMTFSEYETLVHDPFRACLTALPYPDDVDYVVLVRGLPYRVDLDAGGYSASLEALLQIHDTARTSDGAALAGQPQAFDTGVGAYYASVPNPAFIDGFPAAGDYAITNTYEGWYTSSAGVVRAPMLPPSWRRSAAPPDGGWGFGGNLFVVTRLDGFDYQDADDLVDRAVASDGTFPAAELLCMHGGDEARGARDPECEFATRMLAMAGFNAAFLPAFDPALAGHDLAAYFTGAADLRGAIAGNTYAPGAITCNLTSVGATTDDFYCDASGTVCPEVEPQTSIARFIRAGATGAHGCVAEPLNNVFPNAAALLLYTFGYNLGESYFFAQRFLYWQNIYLGDPLATPYAARPAVTIGDGSGGGTVPSGAALVVTAAHDDGIALMALYVDGTRVLQQVTDEIDYTVDAAPGATLDVLAVAVAADAPATRPGWPNPDQMPRPDVQGWSTATITVGAPLPGGTDAGTLPEPPPDDAPHGCACRAAPSRATPPVVLLLLAFAGFAVRAGSRVRGRRR
jgi:uncharacterized protein (TIGR03790 family)